MSFLQRGSATTQLGVGFQVSGFSIQLLKLSSLTSEPWNLHLQHVVSYLVSQA